MTENNEVLIPRFDIRSGKYGYVDKTRNYVIEPKFDQAEPFTNGKALVTIYGKGDFYIDKTGNIIESDEK